MQITRQTEYAIKILVDLSKIPFGQLVSSKQIAEDQEIPEVFLQKTVQILARAGLVTTQRGIQGGVRLAKPGNEITIADVVAVVEGPVAINVCLSPGYQCANQSDCMVHQILNRAQMALVTELSKETIADIAEGNKKN